MTLSYLVPINSATGTHWEKQGKETVIELCPTLVLTLMVNLISYTTTHYLIKYLG